MEELLLGQISRPARHELDRMAPAALTLPGGKARRLDYSSEEGGRLAATVQELLGWRATPRLGSGALPLVIEVLSPARRPVQVTGDLEGFWRGTYPQVRRELRGRYPKHRWPEDPLKA